MKNWVQAFAVALLAGHSSLAMAGVGSPVDNGGASGFPIVIGSTTIPSGGTVTTIAGLTLSGATLSGTTTLPNSASLTSGGGAVLTAALTYGGVTLSNAVTGTGPMVLGTSPNLTTPNIGVAVGSSLALAGATIGSDKLAVTGTSSFSGTVQLGSGASLGMSAGFPKIISANLGVSTTGTGQFFFTAPGQINIQVTNNSGTGLNLITSADGVARISNQGDTDFGRLQFGGPTASFPAIARSGAAFAFRLADGSADAAISAAAISSSATIATAGYTVAGLPTAGTAGRRAYVTNQLTTCAVAGAVLTGGGAVVCPVFDNGVAWVGD